MVGVAGPVQVHVGRVLGELALVLLLQHLRVAGLGQEPVEELDVARVKHRVEAVRAGVGDDQRPALLDERLAPVEVEEVPPGHELHQERVQDRVDVVRRDERDPVDEHVGLEVHVHQVLGPAGLQDPGVGGLGPAGVHRDDVVGGRHGLEDLPLGGGGQALEHGPHPLQLEPVGVGVAVLPLHEEVELAVEHPVVDGGLDVEDVQVAVDDLADAIHRPVHLGALRVDVRVAVGDVPGRVVRLHALVVGEAGPDRLVAAVHGDEVQVHVDDQVRLGRAAVDDHLLAVGGRAQGDQTLRVLGVVVVVAVRVEGLEDGRPHHALHLGLGHVPVQRHRDDQVDVVHPRVGEERQDHLQHLLAHVGGAHGRERERDVVEGDGHLHARPEQGVERLAAVRLVDGLADGRLDVGEPLDGRPGVDDLGADGQVLDQQVLAGEEHPRRRVPVDGDDLLGGLVEPLEAPGRAHGR